MGAPLLAMQPPERLCIDVAHQRYLSIPFLNVSLVDADSIDPP